MGYKLILLNKAMNIVNQDVVFNSLKNYWGEMIRDFARRVGLDFLHNVGLRVLGVTSMMMYDDDITMCHKVLLDLDDVINMVGVI